MKNKMLYCSTARRGYSLVEAKLGRLMRAPDDHEEPEAEAEGEIDEDANNDDDGNNIDQKFDISALFPDADDGLGEEYVVPNSEELSQYMNDSIKGIKAESILSNEVMEQMSSGDFSGFNANMSTFGSQIATAAVKATLKAMSASQAETMSLVQNLVKGTRSNDKNNSLLESSIPAAKDPVLGPAVKDIYKRAIKLHKGNAQEAVEATRTAMALMGIGQPQTKKSSQSNDKEKVDWSDYFKN